MMTRLVQKNNQNYERSLLHNFIESLHVVICQLVLISLCSIINLCV